MCDYIYIYIEREICVQTVLLCYIHIYAYIHTYIHTSCRILSYPILSCRILSQHRLLAVWTRCATRAVDSWLMPYYVVFHNVFHAMYQISCTYVSHDMSLSLSIYIYIYIYSTSIIMYVYIYIYIYIIHIHILSAPHGVRRRCCLSPVPDPGKPSVQGR